MNLVKISTGYFNLDHVLWFDGESSIRLGAKMRPLIPRSYGVMDRTDDSDYYARISREDFDIVVNRLKEIAKEHDEGAKALERKA